MKANKALVVLMGLVVSGFILAFAQTSISQLLELEEFPPLDLPLAPAGVASESGNFFSAANPDWPPMPGLVGARQSLPIYSLAAEFGQPAGAPYYLVDDRQYVWLKEAQAAGLISGEMMTMDFPELPGDGEGTNELGGGWTNNYVSPVYTTNDLWLSWIEGSVTNGQGTLDLHIPEDLLGETWFIWATTNLSVNADPWALSVSNWTWVAVAEPGQTNVTVLLLADDTCFYRLAHPDNDGDFDGLTDYWTWLHFGHALGWALDNSRADDDYDGDGVSNADEFANQTDPNTLSFTAHAGYGHVSITNPTAAITVLGGVPAEVAVLVNSTNFADASWQSYTPTPVILLSGVEGEHKVWLAVRGRVFTNAFEWQGFSLVLDQTPPQLVFTSPVAGVTSKPVLQLQGWTTDTVASVSCTLSNAAGVQTNLSGYVTGQDFGPPTTNRFQCFDLELAMGANDLTFTVMDLAGNSTSTNLSVTFDTSGDTNAPVLTQGWPQAGTRLAMDTFTLRGRVDDETVEVGLSIVGTNGVTNAYSGIVERNGAIWVENVAVAPGTNWVTLVVTDAATNLTITNFSIVRSAGMLTINEVPDSELNNPFVTVSGTIGDSSYSVWVNGVQATVNGDGTWVAYNVPVPPGGSAVFAVRAIPSGGASTPGNDSDPTQNNPDDPNAEDGGLEPEKDVSVTLVYGEWERHQSYEPLAMAGPPGGPEPIVAPPSRVDSKWRWSETNGGYAELTATTWGVSTGYRYWQAVDGMERFESWEGDPGQVTSTNAWNVADVFWPGFTLKGPAAEGRWERRWTTNWASYTDEWVGKSMNLLLRTGGRAGLQRQSLIEIAATAARKLLETWQDIPSPEVTVPGFGTLGADGLVYAAMADNSAATVTPEAAGSLVRKEATPTKFKLRIFWNGVDITDQKTNAVIVGERMELSCALDGQPAGISLTNFEWTIPGYAISNFVATVDAGTVYADFPTDLTNIVYYWVDGGSNRQVQCRAALTGATGGGKLSAKTVFNVQRPNVEMTSQVMGTIAADTNHIYNILNGANRMLLHFGGAAQGTNVIPGIKFEILSTDIEGQVFFIQTGSSTETDMGTNGTNYVGAGTGVDNGLIADDHRYPFDASYEGFVATDSPATSLSSAYTNVIRADTFAMHLMFLPTTPGSIPVPIKRVEWAWSASAVLTNSPLNLWEVRFPVPPSNPTPVDTTTYPTWTNHIQPITWTPPL